MNKVQLKILGIQQGNVTSSYTLILEEVNGDRKLPIIIGVLEAQSIAIEMEKIEPVRPLTHDLFKSFSTSFGIRIKEVLIYKLFEGIFYSYLISTDGTFTKEIDSRTSDAIALALRFNCPIYAYEHIIEEAGIRLQIKEMTDIEEDEEKMEDEEDQEDEKAERREAASSVSDEDLSRLSISKLKKMLTTAVSDEDYILAAKIRDAIKRIQDQRSGNDPEK
jgi:bifunctional DNase/RNase